MLPNSIYLGSHQSISGGIFNALIQASRLNTNCVQIFTKNSNRWEGKPISDEDANKFITLQNQLNIEVVGHSPYLINLASENNSNLEKSKKSLKEDIFNCLKLKIKYLVLHPGSHKGRGIDNGIRRIADSLNDILSDFKDAPFTLLLETMAGQGDSIGSRLDELQKIRELVNSKQQIGYCLDTCHLFAAGYKFTDKDNFEIFKSALDNILGLENIKVIHLNDSKRELGSRVDRHTHIGIGKIGVDAFSLFLNDNDLKSKIFIIETPKEGEMDNVNLKILKDMIR